jgi:SWI/SNF-related matrix-associated actin-dependent regulator of chromatin subfamily A3
VYYEPFNGNNKSKAEAVRRLVTLIDSLCIRRTQARINLPKAQSLRKGLEFSREEHLQYKKAMSDMERSLKEQAGNSESLKDFGLFHITLQLRILCNHGTYQQPFAWRRNAAWTEMREFALTSMVATGQVVCSYCRQVMPVTSARNIYRLFGEQCRHAICDLCSGTADDGEAEDEKDEIQCPICAQNDLLRGIKAKSTARRVLDEHYFQADGYSTKMATLVSDLEEDLNQKRQDPYLRFMYKR